MMPGCAVIIMIRAILIAIMIMAAMVLKAQSADINVDLRFAYKTLSPLGTDQQIITVNDMFPGPQINATTEDILHISVSNSLDESLLITWDGVHMQRNSWQDGVLGTNCPIPVGTNWTYKFQIKDQIGSFFYFLSTNFQKAAGGFGSIQVDNPDEIPIPFPPPDDDIVVLIGDWYKSSHKDLREILGKGQRLGNPDGILINGKGPYNNTMGFPYEIITVHPGLLYRFRVSNVGVGMSLNLRIQRHRMTLVEVEGSYVESIETDGLDVHVGQSYSFLLKADQPAGEYYIVASPRVANFSTKPLAIVGIAILRYSNASTTATGHLPEDPQNYDRFFSLDQTRSIRCNISASGSRMNAQGSFQEGKIPINKTYLFQGSTSQFNGKVRFAVNGISYLVPDTPLMLANHYNIKNVFNMDSLPLTPPKSTISAKPEAPRTSVVSGLYQGFVEYIFINTDEDIQTWHTDGFSFFVVGMGSNPWRNVSRNQYNHWNPVSRCTIQVYPGMWTAVLLELDNVGMWNIRSENLERWYLGQEFYISINDPNDDKLNNTESLLPSNLLYCGELGSKNGPSNQGNTPTIPPEGAPESEGPSQPPPQDNTNTSASNTHHRNPTLCNILVALTLCLFAISL